MYRGSKESPNDLDHSVMRELRPRHSNGPGVGVRPKHAINGKPNFVTSSHYRDWVKPTGGGKVS